MSSTGQILAAGPHAIPAAFLIFPYYQIPHPYGLLDSLWAVIAGQVTYSTPFALLNMLTGG